MAEELIQGGNISSKIKAILHNKNTTGTVGEEEGGIRDHRVEMAVEGEAVAHLMVDHLQRIMGGDQREAVVEEEEGAIPMAMVHQWAEEEDVHLLSDGIRPLTLAVSALSS